MNSIIKMMFKIWILPLLGKFVSNSTQILTDMNTVLGTAPLATQLAAAQAAAGPITDLPGMLASIKLNFQEAAEKLAYILSGSMVQGSLTNPTGGLVLSTDSNHAIMWDLLTGIYQIIK